MTEVYNIGSSGVTNVFHTQALRDGSGTAVSDVREARFVLKRLGYVRVRRLPTVNVGSQVSLTPVWLLSCPSRYDFFIVSQAVRSGSVSPTHYNVIYDNSGLKPDHIQRLTYKLCHIYYNWPVSVLLHLSQVHFSEKGLLCL